MASVARSVLARGAAAAHGARRGMAAAATPAVPTATYLLGKDAALKPLAGSATAAKYAKPADAAAVERAKAALEAKGHTVSVVATGAEALAEIKARIPAGATVHSTSSISLTQIGYIDYAMAGNLPYTNLNAGFLAEKDPKKQGELRRAAALADIVLTTPTAVTEAGEVIIVDASGTRVNPALQGRQAIVVVGTNKIVPTHADGIRRLHEYVYPLESARMREFYNNPKISSTIANIVTINHSSPVAPKRVHLILVKESLGY